MWPPLEPEFDTPPTAQQLQAWFLNKTADPRLSMLREFAAALGVDVRELFGDEKKRK